MRRATHESIFVDKLENETRIQYGEQEVMIALSVQDDNCQLVQISLIEGDEVLMDSRCKKVAADSKG